MTIKLFLQAIITFLLIDSVWITQVAGPWMRKATPHLMAENPSLIAALVFYVLYIAILLFLVVVPALNGKVAMSTLALQAFLFGLVCYATYDLTNLAVMKGYPWTMALADMLWGGVLTMVTALIVYKINM